MAKVLDSGLQVNEFELQSFHYVLLRTNAPGKSMNPLSSQQWVK